MDKNKRRFLTHYPCLQVGNFIESFRAGMQAAREREEADKFFETYESSYALTLAYPDDILIETAQSYGIDTEDREKKEIVKELFEKHGGYGT